MTDVHVSTTDQRRLIHFVVNVNVTVRVRGMTRVDDTAVITMKRTGWLKQLMGF